MGGGRCISVRGSFYDRLTKYCADHGLTAGEVVELATRDLTAVPQLRTRPAARRGPYEIELSSGFLELVDDQVVRELELRGREVTPGQLLDEAINRYLDWEARRS